MEERPTIPRNLMALVNVAVLLTLALVVLVVFLVQHFSLDLYRIQTSSFAVQRLSQEILFLDEMLASDIAFAALLSDPLPLGSTSVLRQRRVRAHEAAIDSAPNDDAREAAILANAAFEQLSLLEEQTLLLLNEGDFAAATKLIDSDELKKWRDDHHTHIDRFSTLSKGAMGAALVSSSKRLRIAQFGTYFCLILMLGLWLVVMRALRHHYVSLRETQVALVMLTSDLEERTEEQRFIFENAGDFVYRCNDRGVFEYISPAISNVTGYSTEEWASDFRSYLTHHPVNLEMRLSAALEPEPTHFVVEIWHKNGHPMMMELHETPYFEEGKLFGVVGVGRNVTQRVEAQQRARESAARIRAIVEAAPDAIVTIDQEGSIESFNPEAERLFGFSFAEVENTPLSNLVAEQVEWTDVAEGREATGVKKDGSLVPLAISAAQTNIAGLTMSTVIFHNISERKRAEAETKRLAHALESSADAVIITDPSGSIEYVNAAFSEMTGWGADEVLAKNPRILQSGLTVPGTYQEMWEALRRGEVWSGRLLNKRKDSASRFEDDSELYWVHSTISPVHDVAGKVTAFVEVQRDITAKVEEEIRTSRSQVSSEVRSAVAHILHSEDTSLQTRLADVLAYVVGFMPLESHRQGSVLARLGNTDEVEELVVIGYSCKNVLPENWLSLCEEGIPEISPCYCLDHENDEPHGHYLVPMRYAGQVHGALVLYCMADPVTDSIEMEMYEDLGELLGYAVATDEVQRTLTAARLAAEEANRNDRAIEFYEL
ncbi:MAG: PAS domain S-box protein, partial [Proteobacteria bacterium]|nr:PAS domain S-box protein [Pseudomonadota bacterium]